MRTLFICGLALLGLSRCAFAQGGGATSIRSGTALPSVCTPSSGPRGNLFYLTTAATGLPRGVYLCIATDKWIPLRTLSVDIANASSTGTTANKAAKLTGAPSTALITAAGDTNGILGVVISGAGTTGSATIALSGRVAAVFDGATTAGHYVQGSASVAGDFTDAGGTYPTSGQIDGIVLSTNGGGGTYDMILFPPEIRAASSATLTAHTISVPLTCADTSGSATTYTCSTTPSFSPANQDAVLFTNINQANSGSSTLNVNGAGAVTIKKLQGGSNLVANDLRGGGETLMQYDGTSWQLLSQVANAALPSTGSTGIVAETSSGVTAARTITTTGCATIADGDGVSGNPTIDSTGCISAASSLPVAVQQCVPGAIWPQKALPIGGYIGGSGASAYWEPWSNNTSSSSIFQPWPVAGCTGQLSFYIKTGQTTGNAYTNVRLAQNSPGIGYVDYQFVPGITMGTSDSVAGPDTWSRLHNNAEGGTFVRNDTPTNINGPATIAGWMGGFYPDDGVTGVIGIDTGALTVVHNTSHYYIWGGRGQANNTDETLAKVYMPFNYTAGPLDVASTQTLANTGSQTYTFRINGAGSTLVATQPLSGVAAPYFDHTHLPTGSAGDLADLEITNNMTATSYTGTVRATVGLNFGAGQGMIVWPLGENGCIAGSTIFYPAFDTLSQSQRSTTANGTDVASPTADAWTISNCGCAIKTASTSPTVISVYYDESTSGTPTVSTTANGAVALTGSIATAAGHKLALGVACPASGTQPVIASCSCGTS